MSKINLVLDLDNTLISSVSAKELETMKNKGKDIEKLPYADMKEGKKLYYRVYYRPHLKEFLDYVFKNFNITIWTAASKDYANFIIEHILIKNVDPSIFEYHPEIVEINFLYDDNCDQSQQIYKNESPKDLRYLYHLNKNKFHSCNTIIMDDLYEVYQVNPKQTLRAIYFDAKKDYAIKDDFLLHAMKKLENVRLKFQHTGCTLHK